MQNDRIFQNILQVTGPLGVIYIPNFSRNNLDGRLVHEAL